MTMTISPKLPNNTQDRALKIALTAAQRDGSISFPEAEEFEELAGTNPSKTAATLLGRAAEQATGRGPRAMLLGVVDNFDAGVAADKAVRQAVNATEHKVDFWAANKLVAAVDLSQTAVTARLQQLVDAKNVRLTDGAKPVIVAAIAEATGAPAPSHMDVFLAVLESKDIAFDGATGIPAHKVKTTTLAPDALSDDMRALYDQAKHDLPNALIRGPWAIEHAGSSFQGFFVDESEHGAAVLAGADGTVLLNEFVLIHG